MSFKLTPIAKSLTLTSILTLCLMASPSVLQAQSGITTSTEVNIIDVPDSAEAVKPLKTGDKAANATVKDARGNDVQLADVYSSAPTVLIFYRGGWCPYCTAHLAKLGSIEDDLTSAGYQIVAISPDAPEFLIETSDKGDTDFTLLSDSETDAARAFGLAFRVDDATVDRYLAFENPIDLERRSGKTHHILPVPAAYVIDQQGNIKFAFTSPDYKKRVDEKALLDAALEAQE